MAAAVVAWDQRYLSGGNLDLYNIFPLFGLLAFSLMWSHYIGGALQRYFDHDGRVLRTYFTVTSSLVLALILLHPGLFVFQLWRDGFGLPPVSYLNFYTQTVSHVALILGTISLIIFLLFELHRKFRNTKWWKYVEFANILAMFAIFYHALRLGRVFSEVWYMNLWFSYGILLVIAIVYNYTYDKRKA